MKARTIGLLVGTLVAAALLTQVIRHQRAGPEATTATGTLGAGTALIQRLRRQRHLVRA
jgi:hypothetical protein